MAKQSDIVYNTTKTIGYSGYNFKFYYEGGAYIDIGLSKKSIMDCINVFDYEVGKPQEMTYADLNLLCKEWINDYAEDFIENYIPYANEW